MKLPRWLDPDSDASPSERKLLAAARPVAAPPAGSRKRVAAAVLERIAKGASDAAADDSVSADLPAPAVNKPRV